MVRTLPPVRPSRPEPPVVPDWSSLIARAVTRGIVSGDQADQLRVLALGGAAELGVEHGGRARAYVAEALEYVGAALVLVAGVVTAQQFWADLAPWAHAGLLGTLAVLLLAAGALVHGSPRTPFGRLGSILWVLAVVAVAGTAAVVVTEMLELEVAIVIAGLVVAATVTASLVAGYVGAAFDELSVTVLDPEAGRTLDQQTVGGPLTWVAEHSEHADGPRMVAAIGGREAPMVLGRGVAP